MHKISLWKEFGFGAFEVKWNGQRWNGHPVTDAEAVECLTGKAGRGFVRKETLDIREKDRPAARKAKPARTGGEQKSKKDNLEKIMKKLDRERGDST